VHLRLNNIDPEASPFELGDTTRALWSALFPYFAKGRDAPETLQAEIVLPSEVLHQALLSLGECEGGSGACPPLLVPRLQRTTQTVS
jgi:hypothetical protein